MMQRRLHFPEVYLGRARKGNLLEQPSLGRPEARVGPPPYLFENFPNSRNMSLRVQKRFWGSKKIWMPTPAVHSV